MKKLCNTIKKTTNQDNISRQQKKAYRKNWTLDEWSGPLASGRLDAWDLDAWILNPWS